MVSMPYVGNLVAATFGTNPPQYGFMLDQVIDRLIRIKSIARIVLPRRSGN